MLHNLEFKNFTPSPHLRELVENLIVGLEKRAPKFSADAASLRLFVDENATRSLYHVSLTCNAPGRLRLAALEERHDAEVAVREAFTEIERQLERRKGILSQSYLYKNSARREELLREKAKAVSAGERERGPFSPLVERHLKSLYNFVRREIASHLATGDLAPGDVTAEDVMDVTLPRAYSEFVKKPAGRNIRSWLLQHATEQLEAEVERSKVERAGARRIEKDNPETPPTEAVSAPGDEIMDFYQPDEDQKLEDIIPDMTAPTPEQILESRELQRYINRTLATLPRVWRRAFVLHYVEDVPVAEIARMTRRTESEVERHLEYTRECLRERLRDAGVEVPPHNQAALTVFGTAADVDVPAIIRNAVIEKYRKLEETGDVYEHPLLS